MSYFRGADGGEFQITVTVWDGLVSIRLRDGYRELSLDDIQIEEARAIRDELIKALG